eukprot:1502204-Prymnesium_polylepis.1
MQSPNPRCPWKRRVANVRHDCIRPRVQLLGAGECFTSLSGCQNLPAPHRFRNKTHYSVDSSSECPHQSSAPRMVSCAIIQYTLTS